jgi:hypothetical protein
MSEAEPIRYSGNAFAAPIQVFDVIPAAILSLTAAGAVRMGKTGGSVGFYGTTPIAKQTGVAVDAAGIHAALVALGLIAA